MRETKIGCRFQLPALHARIDEPRTKGKPPVECNDASSTGNNSGSSNSKTVRFWAGISGGQERAKGELQQKPDEVVVNEASNNAFIIFPLPPSAAAVVALWH